MLTQHVLRVRSAILRVPPAEWSTDFLRNFPRGACGDASYLLAAYLIDEGVEDLARVVARPRGEPNATHVWLQHCGAVIDITAGQFSDAPDKVIVAAGSPWHQNRFEIYDVGDAEFRVGNPQGFESLFVDYDIMRAHLPEFRQ